MKAYSKQEALLYMNYLGGKRRPFLFIINYLQDIIYIEEIGTIHPEECMFDFNGFTNIRSHLIEYKSVKWNIYPISFDEYSHSFRIVESNIYGGNSYLVNLTCATPVKTNLSLKEIFYRSIAKYKLWFNDEFVVFSPEIFIRISEGYIRSYPMKGTLDASLPDAYKRLMENKKEMAEHATIVDLIRNDLSIVAEDVSVTRFCYIDELRTNNGKLLQMSSEVTGRLSDDWQSHIGDILFPLLPAGSITGAPKKKTMQIIKDAEMYERGFYTGICGYFNGEVLDSAVMIRFLERRGEDYFFKSGGGITSQSNLLSEYEEMKQKVYVPIY